MPPSSPFLPSFLLFSYISPVGGLVEMEMAMLKEQGSYIIKVHLLIPMTSQIHIINLASYKTSSTL